MVPQDLLAPAEARKLKIAAEIANSYFPYLSGIFSKLDVRFDSRIETAAVTGSGKLLFNRQFFHMLAPGLETAFILAHEMLHLAQLVFERGRTFPDKESLNIAHDILINELLCDTMKLDVPPCDGLSWDWFLKEWDSGGSIPIYRHEIPGLPSPGPRASAYSLEEMVRIIVSVKNTSAHPGNWSWDIPSSEGIAAAGDEAPATADPFPNRPFADLFDGLDGSGPSAPKPAARKRITLDMIGEDAEATLFPDEDRKERERRRSVLREICSRAAVQNVILSSWGKGRGDAADVCVVQAVDIVRSRYAPPWEMAMQRWFDGIAVPRRSWGRASRRGAWRNDVVLPGREQERSMLHIVLDTSGSMTDAIPSLLGKIGAFARNAAMTQVHILQCDTEVTEDDFIDIDQLGRFRVSGYGGSDMSPAMRKLAEDPEIRSVLVITDGDIDYPPAEKIPYDVLWCLPEDRGRDGFPYGRVIRVPVSEEA